MQVKQILSVPKETDYPQSNEDYFNMSNCGNSCALSDGASESYDSKTWAKLLCNTFNNQTKRKLFGKFCKPKEVKKVIDNSRSKFFDFFSSKQLSWSQKAAFERGSFASLVGVIDHGKSIEILAVGDTIALWQSQKQSISSFFLTEISEFDKQPLLLSTDHNLDDSFFRQENLKWSTIKIKKKEVLDKSIFLLTDAIGKKIIELIKEGNITFAFSILKTKQKEFENWVLHERTKNKIRTDDTTAVWIKIDETPKS